MANAEVDGMAVVQDALPNTEVWAVTVLTSLDEELCQFVFTGSTKAAVLRFARLAKLAGLRDLILSPLEAEMLSKRRELKGMSLNTPGIRYPWSEIGDQKRFLTAREAIEKGTTRVVVGRPILNAKPNNEGRPQSPREALDWIMADIAQAKTLVQ